MALAQRAYRTDAYPDYAPQPSRTPEVRASRTGAPEQQPSSSILVMAAKMAAIVLIVVAALSFARITLTSATVTTMIESDAISSEISEARTAGVSLEMEQSVLSNSSAIKHAAKRLGMAAPFEVESIELSPDVVATDANGNLSLSGTVKNFVEVQG